VTCGVDRPEADLSLRDAHVDAGGSRATLVRRRPGAEDVIGTIRVGVPGRHNLQNALATVAVGLELSLPFDAIAAGLAAFGGVDRRFERKGEAAGVIVVDDYGHHPSEIAAVLRAARTGHGGRVVVAFQPHRYTRTRQLRDEFGQALALADVIVLTGIYGAGEDPLPGVTLEWLAASVEAAAPGRVHVVPDMAQVSTAIARIARAGDLVITLGAGSIGECGDLILAELRRCP
jgi:UDP-N-acetylmuramate--alanine ligase